MDGREEGRGRGAWPARRGACAGRGFAKAAVDRRAGIGVDDVPHLGLGLASDGGGRLVRRVDLDAELLLGVDELQEEREARPLGGGADERLAELVAERLEVASGEGAVRDDARAVWVRGDFPRLGADGGRVVAAEAAGDAVAAPEVVAVHVPEEERVEAHGGLVLRGGLRCLKALERLALGAGMLGAGREEGLRVVGERARER